MTKILLGGDEVNPDKEDNDSQTPLMCSTKHGHRKVIALLQLYEAVALSAVCGFGATSS